MESRIAILIHKALLQSSLSELKVKSDVRVNFIFNEFRMSLVLSLSLFLKKDIGHIT